MCPAYLHSPCPRLTLAPEVTCSSVHRRAGPSSPGGMGSGSLLSAGTRAHTKLGKRRNSEDSSWDNHPEHNLTFTVPDPLSGSSRQWQWFCLQCQCQAQIYASYNCWMNKNRRENVLHVLILSILSIRTYLTSTLALYTTRYDCVTRDTTDNWATLLKRSNFINIESEEHS